MARGELQMDGKGLFLDGDSMKQRTIPENKNATGCPQRWDIVKIIKSSRGKLPNVREFKNFPLSFLETDD